MAQTKQSSKSNSSSSYGEGAVRQANVLASCYITDNSATELTSFHYCTTTLTGLPSPPTSPPLAAITDNNVLTVFPKKRGSTGSNSRAIFGRRGGAALRIREECERLFCEPMKTAFLGERSAAGNGSDLTSVYHDADHQYGHANGQGYGNVYDYVMEGCKDADLHGTRIVGSGVYSPNGQLCTPPDDDAGSHFAALCRTPSADSRDSSLVAAALAGCAVDDDVFTPYAMPTAWFELWDFAGCASFRGFLVEDPTGARSLFALFDASLMGRNLKQSLMALIELAESALDCAHLVICMDRRAMAEPASADDAAEIMKGLQWAGFSLTTLDAWTGGVGVDVTSPAWIFMGMEL